MFWFNLADESNEEPESETESDSGHEEEGSASEEENSEAPNPDEIPTDGTDNEIGEEVQDVLSKILPWGVSILLHAGVILLAVFAAWTVAPEKVTEEEVIIPIARLSSTPGAPLSMRTSNAANLSAVASSSVSRSTSSTAIASSVSSNALSEAIGSGTGTGGGVGSGAGAGSGDGASGGLIGIGGGGGGSGGGKASPFGSGVGGGGSFKASFYGTGGNARRIAYLVDASGNLIDTLPFVLTELKRSIGELSDQQEFIVIFFQGNDPKEIPTPNTGLKKANSETKKRVFDWIDQRNIIPQGGNSPIKALQLALRYKPQLMFVLSGNITGEGKYQVDQRRLLQEIKINNTASTKINTIQFIFPDPLESLGLEPTMKLIAKGSGGVYKFLSAQELGIQ